MGKAKRPPRRAQPRVTRTRHAPDGSEVPIESDRGLTLHDRVAFPDLDAFLTWHPTTEKQLHELESTAQRVLEAAGPPQGLPTTFEPLEIHPDGTWAPLSDGKAWALLTTSRSKKEVWAEVRARKLGGVTLGDVTDLVKDRPHTPEWFAAKIVQLAHLARNAIEAGDASEAVRLAVLLGGYWMMAAAKGAWEADAIRGARQPRHGKLGGEAKGAAYRNRNQRLTEAWRRITDQDGFRHVTKDAIAEELRSRWTALGFQGDPPSAKTLVNKIGPHV